ncbi:MAG: DUF4236 domain-containing protein [Armatimonadetes bacterium]|nr:DUF4236 domain-containing protein [Armatimonadota bacterium]
MGLRFHRSFKLFPGVRLNVSKSGFSTSFGVRGATINVGPRGVRGTVGIPGTGLSYSAKIAPGAPSLPVGAPYWSPPHSARRGNPVLPVPPQNVPYIPSQGMNQISSAAVEWLTSDGLQDLRDMLVDAKRQRQEIREDLLSTKKELAARERELRWKDSFLRFLFKKRVAELSQLVPELRRHIGELNAWNEATHIDIQFETGNQALRAYGDLVRAYEACRNCQAIWDVTADRATNRVVERTTATRTVDRRPVRFEYDDSDIIRFKGRAMRLSNANGDDLLLYPGIILIPRADGAFALLDFRDVMLHSGAVDFIESERIPADSKVVGHTWAKANKDGSPDRRFASNYQIPVCEYGRLHFASRTGLNEEFQLSNSMAAISFGHAFTAYSRALSMAPSSVTAP